MKVLRMIFVLLITIGLVAGMTGVVTSDRQEKREVQIAALAVFDTVEDIVDNSVPAQPEPATEPEFQPSIAEVTPTVVEPTPVVAEVVEPTPIVAEVVIVETVEVAEPVAVEPIVEATSAPTYYTNYTITNVNTYTLRTQATITNNGNGGSSNITVSIPGIQNHSPINISHAIQSQEGRMYHFVIDSLEVGQSVVIYMDFAIKSYATSFDYNDPSIDVLYSIYNKHKGSGNCRDLVRSFISECAGAGFEAREVIGYARPQRSNMTSGSLQGCRHSWAEVYVDSEWVQIDLTFQYFGSFPHTSHVFESHSDQSIKVNYTGGSLSAAWVNEIL